MEQFYFLNTGKKDALFRRGCKFFMNAYDLGVPHITSERTVEKILAGAISSWD